jgi:hypothetical protein
MHIYIRIEPRWTSIRSGAPRWHSREVERRAPALATSKWWKEERHGVFLDYNQNAKGSNDRRRVRPRPDARVSAPLAWARSPRANQATSRCGRCRRASRRSGSSSRHRRSAVFDRTAAGALGTAGIGRLGDAPWPPHYRKQASEPPRVAPSKRRVSKHPLIEGRARKKDDALAGLERWKARHPEAAAHLEPADVRVDAMRGRFQTWTRIRINLQHVPEPLRPAQETLDPNDDVNDWSGVSAEEAENWRRRRPSRARKES